MTRVALIFIAGIVLAYCGAQQSRAGSTPPKPFTVQLGPGCETEPGLRHGQVLVATARPKLALTTTLYDGDCVRFNQGLTLITPDALRACCDERQVPGFEALRVCSGPPVAGAGTCAKTEVVP